jgi:PLP dependent protein
MNESIQNVQLLVSKYAVEAHRTPSDIRLIAVSKMHPSSAVRDAYLLGLRDFGENYADELASKQTELSDLNGIRWSYIGQLQSNKIQTIVKHADEIQSVATEKHARYIQRYAEQAGKKNYPVWIVINSENEPAKQGVTFENAIALSQFIREHCPALTLQGLMAIPPSTYSDAAWKADQVGVVPQLYQNLRMLSRSIGLGRLSLGMSGDLRLAIHAGSDCVRIGTAIFGNRTLTSHKEKLMI